MPFQCPHCSEPIENAVDKSALKERIDAKNAEVKLLKDQLGEQAAKLKESEGLSGRVAELEAELSGTLRKTALAAKGITDEKVIRTLELVYDSEMAGRDEGERVDFSDFSWAQDHPLFGNLFAEADAAAEQSTPPAQAPVPGVRTPPRVQANPPPPRQGKMTARQVQEYFASAEFRAMSREDQRAKMAELEAQVSG